MPRIKISPTQQSSQATTWQQTISDRIRSGKLVPIVSNSISNDLVLGGHSALVDAYVDYSGYPLDRSTLAQMAQFKSITDDRLSDALALKDDYVNFIKNRLFDIAEASGASGAALEEIEEQFDALTFSEFSQQLGYPRFEDEQSHPMLLLASFGLPIYITTSYHNFLETALRRAGKEPRIDICRWHTNLDAIPSPFADGYVPSPEEPLVYHLHGFDQYPDSLVLTEDDYLHFLVATSENFGRPTDPVHARVRQAMSDSSLMLLGYELRNWEFRSLFWGLIAKRHRRLTSVLSIQLEPSEIEKLYLQKYLDDFEFKVYWGRVDAYVQDLYQSLNI